MGRSFPARLIQKFIQDQGVNWAVVIAWNGLFAMFPIVLFISAIVGLALSFAGISSGVVYRNILLAIPDTGARTEVLKALDGVQTQTGLLFIVGLLGLLWGGSALFGSMEEAFAAIYHTRTRDFVQQKLMSIGMVFVFVALGSLAVGTSSLLPALKHIPAVPALLMSGSAAFLLQMLVGIVAGFLLFGTIYFVVPHRKQQWRKVWPGALFSGVLFEVIALLFPTYLSVNRGINAYGQTFGLFFILLTFFFLVGLITMLGAEVNSILYPFPITRPTRRFAVAPPQSGSEADIHTWSTDGGLASANGEARRTPQRPGIQARTAIGLTLAGTVIGVLLGRRHRNKR